MKMTYIETQTIKTRIRKVERYQRTAKNGKDYVVVSIKTDDGFFTNFLNVWKDQDVDLADIEEGDEIEITYFVSDSKDARGRRYKNFLKVRPCAKYTWKPTAEELIAGVD